MAGSVSGGCLEADIAMRAAEVCASGQSVRLRYDLRADLETIWGYGAACDGIAHLLLEPLPLGETWFAAAEAVRQRRESGAVVTTLTATGGASEAVVGDRAARSSLQPLLDAAYRTASALMVQRDDERSVFVDPLIAPIALHLVGAGRGAEAFARIATTLGWSVSILDHRPALLESIEVSNDVRRVAVRGADGIREALLSLPRDARTAVALLSHVFELDAAWLEACLSEPIGYIGILGSRSRGAQLLDRVSASFEAAGTPLSPRLRQRVYAPIGLDLGGEDPASIALASIAEIEAVLHGRPGGFLRERLSPIHTRTPTPRLLDAPDDRDVIRIEQCPTSGNDG